MLFKIGQRAPAFDRFIWIAKCGRGQQDVAKKSEKIKSLIGKKIRFLQDFAQFVIGKYFVSIQLRNVDFRRHLDVVLFTAVNATFYLHLPCWVHAL